MFSKAFFDSIEKFKTIIYIVTIITGITASWLTVGFRLETSENKIAELDEKTKILEQRNEMLITTSVKVEALQKEVEKLHDQANTITKILLEKK